MSKGNLFLGYGRGAVGDVVFSRQNGEQVARARNRSPRNPKTALQLLQRVCMKTVSQAYSVFQEITNHSFQGLAEGTDSQARFVKLNIDRLRARLAVEIESGEWEEIINSSESNFAAKSSSGAEFMPYVMSEGSLPIMNYRFALQSGADRLQLWGASGEDAGQASPTYAQVCSWLGLQQGDQLTFCFASIDDTQEVGVFNGFDYGRIILEPADGDMSKSFISNGAINDPNPKNKGAFTFQIATVPSELPDQSYYYLMVAPQSMDTTKGKARSIGAAAVIVSRLVGGTQWARSSQSLLLRSDIVTDPAALNLNHSVDLLGDAIRSYMSEANSSLYLNQATV